MVVVRFALEPKQFTDFTDNTPFAPKVDEKLTVTVVVP
jgi:hypothetical protein